jgi:hypothetical protein
VNQESKLDEYGLLRLIEYARREAFDQRHEVAAFFLDLAARSLSRDESERTVVDVPARWVG